MLRIEKRKERKRKEMCGYAELPQKNQFKENIN